MGSLPIAIFYSFFVDYYVSSLTGAVKEQGPGFLWDGARSHGGRTTSNNGHARPRYVAGWQKTGDVPNCEGAGDGSQRRTLWSPMMFRVHSAASNE